ALFAFLAEARRERPDLFFHNLPNGQHFEAGDGAEIRASRANCLWGIPLYSHDAPTHDAIVAKSGAYDRLLESLIHCLSGGMRIELRTVLLQTNIADLPALARFAAQHLGFISQWSIMQLENIGFAKNRFAELYVDHGADFALLAEAIDMATLAGIPSALFNMPRCSVPSAYRAYAANSISDWKRRFAPACDGCAERSICSGFFAWHPETHMRVTPL
ncbi:MAG TPA: His-Xaa-Ser system radical SAM maturase HxsC, partial [Sphingopyxis sp.]|nr:His-Xaa-Ser system radical SAM maturase HxsC [Sphingopyxis sp.]